MTETQFTAKMADKADLKISNVKFFKKWNILWLEFTKTENSHRKFSKIYQAMIMSVKLKFKLDFLFIKTYSPRFLDAFYYNFCVIIAK